MSTKTSSGDIDNGILKDKQKIVVYALTFIMSSNKYIFNGV